MSIFQTNYSYKIIVAQLLTLICKEKYAIIFYADIMNTKKVLLKIEIGRMVKKYIKKII